MDSVATSLIRGRVLIALVNGMSGIGMISASFSGMVDTLTAVIVAITNIATAYIALRSKLREVQCK